jgi:phage terminase large subunit-like protein
MVPINPTESKYSRATAVSPPIESGNVYLPTAEVALGGWDVDAFIEEAAAFPNGAHDDQVDMTSQALNRFFVAGNAGAAWLEHMKAQVGDLGHADWRTRLHAVP